MKNSESLPKIIIFDDTHKVIQRARLPNNQTLENRHRIGQDQQSIASQTPIRSERYMTSSETASAQSQKFGSPLEKRTYSRKNFTVFSSNPKSPNIPK